MCFESFIFFFFYQQGEPVSVVKTESKMDFKAHHEPLTIKLESTDEAHRAPSESSQSSVGKLQVASAPQLHLSPQV
jgi:hypothetical protein